MEEWKPIEHGYFVSTFGRVRSSDTKYNKGQILNPFLGTTGYRRVFIKRKCVYVHRLVAKAFICNPENKPHVNHKNFNKQDNRVDNLEWVTEKENNQHARAAGRIVVKNHFYGESTPNARLNNAAVAEIRSAPRRRGIITRLAAKFGVSNSAISRVIKKVTWAAVSIVVVSISACRSDQPPKISLICLADGAGGMDCVTPDGEKKYLPPSQTTNMWCAPQLDMERFASWCYKANTKDVANKMAEIQEQVSTP